MAILFLLSAGCKHKREWPTPEPIRDEDMLASAIVPSEARSANQLVKGFYEPDDDWCWTAKDFAVKLAPPANAGERGARLELELAVPDALIQRLNSTTLSAAVDGFMLQPETYRRPGEYTYSRDIPRDRLASPSVLVEAHLDKSLAPSPAESRALGIVVRSIGLTAK